MSYLFLFCNNSSLKLLRSPHNFLGHSCHLLGREAHAEEHPKFAWKGQILRKCSECKPWKSHSDFPDKLPAVFASWKMGVVITYLLPNMFENAQALKEMCQKYIYLVCVHEAHIKSRRSSV